MRSLHTYLNEGHYNDIEDLLRDASVGSVASGGGYSFTKKALNHWVAKSGLPKNDKYVASFIGGFDDFKIKDK